MKKIMKKLIFVAVLAIAASIYQPAKAQVSINVNIGARPYYQPNYYSYTSYEVPVRRYYAPRTVVVHRPVYAPARYYYSPRAVNKHYVKSYQKHGKGHFKGRGHGRKH
jgi:hypothetical protein